ncbi:KIN28 [Ecytonucleospora hepatopenaei]|uniref:[RNA-polymerase]-subunit kinase n=1 Tax=Ecytonucleospora hepatopenaei TaxID=646526 RepID=A0A1W0E7P5_9MICR|nr:cyclin-dep ser/thr protein kinase [Ecytonucleospora hepatopenaei]OQS55236.1 KIN28 [Ecytonucleospora hepatopenaei]
MQYFKVKKLGEGTYAVIYLAKAINIDTSIKITFDDPGAHFERLVAIKRIKKTEWGNGLEVNAIREIKALKSLKHDNLLKMEDIFVYKDDIHMVLEYVEYSLEQIIKCNEIIIMPSDIKSWVYMLLNGLNHMHDNFILHRDLKPNNLLINKDGILKLADFGLSRKITERMTPNAVTRWYRAPEMLLGQTQFGFKSDIWSVGVIMAEMFLRFPFLAAETDIQQLETICKVLGTPKNYAYFDTQMQTFKIRNYPKTNLKNIFTAVSEDAIDLLEKMLQINPADRIGIEDALSHEYFSTKPYATLPHLLPKPKDPK